MVFKTKNTYGVSSLMIGWIISFIVVGFVGLAGYWWARGELDSFGLRMLDECASKSSAASRLVRERVRSGKTLSVGLLWRAERIVRSEEREREAHRRATDEHVRKRSYIKHFEDRYKR